MQTKDERLARFCRERGVDGVLIRRRSNVAWVTDGADIHCNLFMETGVAALLWTPQRKVVYCDNVDGPRLAAEEFGPDWEILQTPWTECPRWPEGNLACDYPEDCLADVRASLTEREVERIRVLGAETAEVVADLAHLVQPGMRELDVAADLSAGLWRRGIRTPVVLIAADERIARFRHPHPTTNRLDQLLMIVVCAQRRGLIVALSRLVHFGKLPAELRRRHEAVCRVDEAYHAATRPGVEWRTALAAGIQAYAEVGFVDEWRLHFQGGPMGYETRDYWATTSETRRIVPNQAVAWNPSITGTKSEDAMLSTGEVLTAVRDWPMCGSRPDILVRRAAG